MKLLEQCKRIFMSKQLRDCGGNFQIMKQIVQLVIFECPMQTFQEGLACLSS